MSSIERVMIRMFDYRVGLKTSEKDVLFAIQGVLNSGFLILGPETEKFEKEFAEYTGANYCIAVSSGTTALQIALLASDIGVDDEVITVSNTCAPTGMAIKSVGATAVFADICPETLMIDPEKVTKEINKKTRAIIPVHLWGHAADTTALFDLSKEFDLMLIEDCSQAHGTKLNGLHVGNTGQFGCFSFYPTKNIGAYGDAGAIITNDISLAQRCQRIRNYGYNDKRVSIENGINGRISEMQSAILRIKLKNDKKFRQMRRKNARIYEKLIDFDNFKRLAQTSVSEPSFHQYILRSKKRDALRNWLANSNIETAVHYEVPLHKMPAFQSSSRTAPYLPCTEDAAREILSLPINEHLEKTEIHAVADVINHFTTYDTKDA